MKNYTLTEIDVRDFVEDGFILLQKDMAIFYDEHRDYERLKSLSYEELLKIKMEGNNGR